MRAPSLDVVLPLLGALVLVTLVVAPAGWRLMSRALLLGLALLAVQLLLIEAAPAVGAWITAVAR
ncbi:hypothetical protein ACKI16_29600 [Streptomyces scabiei]|uniref:hypothetical protein n=1 Tax=Streptomyces scabiei TaxID=1930 RepID=UPI0038F775E6